MPRAALALPVERNSTLSAKHTVHGTKIGELLFPTVSESRRSKVLVSSLGIELAPDVDNA